jgi:steroid delta-isomerase-like uncharacterized protein
MSRLLTAAAAVIALAFTAIPAGAFDLAAEKVVNAYLAAWNSHDPAAAAAFLADSVVYYDASLGEPVMGRAEAQANIIQVFMVAVPDLVWEARGPMLSDNGHVAFEWVFSGTNTGPWSDGTPGTGKKFQLFGLSLFQLRGDKIGYQGDYYDALGFYRQLGLME